jgi:hypothetical protein
MTTFISKINPNETWKSVKFHIAMPKLSNKKLRLVEQVRY